MEQTGPTVGFDVDLTLVDSTEGIAATLSAALSAEAGRELRVAPEEVWPWIGFPLEATVPALAPWADTTRVVHQYRARYDTLGVPLTKLLPGAVEAFQAVRAVGGRLLVVSAKAEAGVRAVLDQVGLTGPELGPDLVAGGLFGAAKGELLGLERANVYVGDHSGDVQAARVAGALSVVVCTGPQDAEALTAAGANVLLDDLTAFPDWLSGFTATFARSQPRR